MPVILVVDDECMVRASLRQSLERAGHAVMEAENGLVARDQLRQRQFGLIFLDIFMPQAEGIETLLAIRREGYHIPIVAMSGGGRGKAVDFLALAKKLGADEVLRKPFGHKELLNLVTRLAGGRTPTERAGGAR
jgi:CheY-like chemotaxis protein